MTANKGKGSLRDRGGALVDGLARSVISRVSYDALQGRQARLEAGTQVLLDAALTRAPFDKAMLTATFAELRISREDLVDHCIPRAAAVLGEGWLDDTFTFVNVTTASARLYSLCKEATTDWSPTAIHPDARRVLLATIGQEDHLLGPAILTEQLRRHGHSVRVRLNTSSDAIIEELARAEHDAVFLSVATYRTLDLTAEATKKIIMHGTGVPIYAGGAILDHESELEYVIGADLVTKDLDAALSALAALPSQELVGTE